MLFCLNILSMEQTAGKYIREAKHCLLNHNYGKAYAFYMLVLKLCPHLRNHVADDFASAWREWSTQLRELGKISDLFSLYEQGCDVFMHCDMLHFHMGNALYHLNYKLESIGMFRKALLINEHCSEASISLEHVCRGVIDCWHFSMLNDKKRNQKFEDAIKNIVTSKDIVLDIGSGTGILSMIAVKNGAKKVLACEMSEAMQSVADECAAANGMEGYVTMFKCHSTRLSVDPSASSSLKPFTLPDKCSLVISETVDAGLFGEGIIDALSHAWKNILKSPANGGRVIPCSAKVYCCAIECAEIHRKHVVTSKINLDNVLITSGVGFKDEMFCKNKNGENDVDGSCTNTCDLEPYTSETLKNFSFKILSKKQVLLNVNFNDPQLIETIASESMGEIEQRHEVIESGFIDAIAVWFELALEPNSNSIVIDTAIGTSHCWEQAVYPVRYFKSLSRTCGNFVPVRLEVNDNVGFRTVFHPHCDCLLLDSVILENNLDKQCLSYPQPYAGCHSGLHVAVAEEHIQRINDPTLSNMCFRSLCELKNWNSSFAMLDISNGFDLFAIKCAQTAKISVHKYCQTSTIFTAFCRIAKKCNLNVKFHKQLPPCSDEKFDAIVFHFIEPSGLISPNAISNVCKVKSCLSWSGFFIPNRASLVVQLVESEDLLSKCLVLSDENTLGYEIAETINDFRVSVHSDLEIKHLKFKALSNSTAAVDFDFNDATTEALMNVCKTIVIRATSASRLHAVLFWFKLNVYESDNISTNAPNNHWKQAAYIIPSIKQLELSTNDEVALKVICKDESLLFQASMYGC